MEQKFLVWLDEVGIEDVPLVGGKNASLGEMLRNLSKLGINIPYGFVVTSKAYYEFLRYNKLEEKIRKILEGLNPNNVQDLAKRGYEVRELIKGGEFPPELEELIKKYYSELSRRYNSFAVDVAVRSSATAEDLPNASFAGQQDTYLNVVGAENVLTAIKNGFASLFTDRAISYRESFGFDHFKVGIAMGVQKMVRSDLGASGVMFTLDTESGFKDVVVINATYGLGELLVQGMITPDEYMVFKPTLQAGYSAIIEKKLGRKDRKMVYGVGHERTKIVNVPLSEQKQFALTDEEILKLARWGVLIEEYYSKKNGRWMPMDIEWAKDGVLNELFVVQARPETVHGNPESAFKYSFIPNDGVGLAREEFIIANYIKIHPLALLYYEELKALVEKLEECGAIDERGICSMASIYKHAEEPLKSKLAKGKDKKLINLKKTIEEIENLTFGYEDKAQYFVKKLSYGIAKIAAAFYPNPVIVRFSDFKSNEYKGLIGGELFEPEEENPMLGWRGASRYYSEVYKPAFGLECQAILRVRNKMGLTNTKVMIPFCRTPEEGEKVLKVMEEYGLRRGENGLEVYDDERNEAVKRLISQLISIAKEKGRKVGICGQGPSDFPDFAQFLVEEGIDSISLNPDSVLKTLLVIAEAESKSRKVGV
jgi:phosphoenolpyruvate synthase/pyruvate phosphate dikinase